MKLIVGLGNPGKEYLHTRHNTGFRCIDQISIDYGIRLTHRHPKVHFGSGPIAGTETVLAKPRTYMNESGQAVGWLLSRFHPSLEDLLVIYDDFDLPLGKIRVRPDGGHGGHKGMRSIIAASGRRDFPRVRVGIWVPEAEGIDAVDYVLGNFAREEEIVLGESIHRVSEAVRCILSEGLEAAMNRYN